MYSHTYIRKYSIHKYVCQVFRDAYRMCVSISLYSAAYKWQIVQYGLLDNRMVYHVCMYESTYLST